MKKRLPAIVTVLLLLGALCFLKWRERAEPAGMKEEESAGPEKVIWRMSDVAREGNARAYLDCFAGALQQNLRQTIAEMGEAQFSDYLKRLDHEITGIAVSDLELRPERGEAQEAELRVEFVYRGKNEVQKHSFKRVDGNWKIVGMDNAERMQAPFPYGAPVKEVVRNSERRF